MDDLFYKYLAVAIPGIIAFGGAMYWAGGVNTDVSALKEAVKLIREDIKDILSRLPSDGLNKTSPVHLTELGKEIVAEFEEFNWMVPAIDTSWDFVSQKSSYEIQEYCINLMTVQYSPSSAMDVKIYDCAFKYGMTRRQVLEILAIALRDKMLERLQFSA